MSGSDDILALDSVAHSFGGLAVLRSVTLSVPPAGLIGLIGPNGSGKTTLFNIVSGYLPLQAGRIRFCGERLTTQSVQRRSRAGMVRTFQTPRIFERLTVLENIMVGACKLTRTGMVEDLLRLPHARREIRHIQAMAERVAGDFGLDGAAPASALPAGPRRILEIARALAGEPRLLMLDEPSMGLSPVSRIAPMTSRHFSLTSLSRCCVRNR